MQAWYEFKLFVVHSTAVSMDALHVLGGVALLLLVAALSGWPLGRWSNCLPVLAIELANEWLDVHVESWPHPGMQYGEGAKDVLLTMILPVALTAAARARPDLCGGSRPAGPSAAAAGEAVGEDGEAACSG